MSESEVRFSSPNSSFSSTTEYFADYFKPPSEEWQLDQEDREKLNYPKRAISNILRTLILRQIVRKT